jgi:small subunit ribosomal protein S6
MFLLDSGKYAVDPQGTENALRDLLGRVSGSVVAMAPWQDGKLAYPIDGHKKGLHYLVYFRMDGSQVQEFTRLCRLSELVIRQMLVQHPEKLFSVLADALAQHTAGKGEAAPVPSGA